jgi:hypothetical protein
MNKFLLLFCYLLLSENLFAQKLELLNITSAKIEFISYAPEEVIKASSTKAKGLINPSLQTFAITVDYTSFLGFNSNLQKEHFNERFIESDKYKQCAYSGKIIDKIDWSKEGNYKVRVKGKLNVHGVSVERVIQVLIQINKGKVLVSSNFVVPLSDHEISIPSIVNQKIAEDIDVSFSAIFENQ